MENKEVTDLHQFSLNLSPLYLSMLLPFEIIFKLRQAMYSGPLTIVLLLSLYLLTLPVTTTPYTTFESATTSSSSQTVSIVPGKITG